MRVVGKGVAGSFPYWSHIIWQNFTIQIRIIHVYLSKHSKLWFWLWIVTSKEKRINLNVLVKGISDELLFLNFSFSSSQSLSPFASTKVLGGSQVPQTHVDHVQGNAQDHGWHYASNCLSTSRRKMRGLKEGKNSSFLVGFPNLKKLPTWSWWGRVAFQSRRIFFWRLERFKWKRRVAKPMRAWWTEESPVKWKLQRRSKSAMWVNFEVDFVLISFSFTWFVWWVNIEIHI